MNKLFFFPTLLMFICGCAVNTAVDSVKTPMAENDIKLADLQLATTDCINDLIAKDVLKKKDDSKPFVMVDHIENKFLPHLDTELLAQDIRLAILMSDKAVTMPAPEKKKGKDNKKETAKQLPAFDFFLSGVISKNKLTSPDGEKVDCFAVHYKLKDLKTDLVIWEFEEKLVGESNK